MFINLSLKSSNSILLDNYKNKFVHIFIRNKINFKIIYLPTKTTRYSILRSPHIYKKSIESFKENIFSLNFIISINNKNEYLKTFYILKFIQYNTPLTINLTFKLFYNVKKNIL